MGLFGGYGGYWWLDSYVMASCLWRMLPKIDNIDIIDTVDIIEIANAMNTTSQKNQLYPPSRTRSGVALVVTLGMLAVICVTVIAFIAAMRLERATAGLESDRAELRGLHHVGLASAMQEVTVQLFGNVYATGWFSPTAEGACFGSYYEQSNTTFVAETVTLFTGAATNLVPAAVHADAEAVESYWIPVVSSLSLSSDDDLRHPSDPLAPLLDTVGIGRVAYLVIDCSGFLPPPASNSVGYAAQIHLPAEERDHTFYLAHDPDPEQYFTVRPEFVDEPHANAPGLYATLVTNKFNVNSWTNDLVLTPQEDEVPLAYNPAARAPYVAVPELQPWADNVAASLHDTGFYEPAQAEKMAWSLLNLLDEDRLPQYRLPDGAAPTQPPSRIGYAFEDLPMINEVVVSNATTVAGNAPAYSVAVELWYPFEPDQSPENLVLAVGVYTNKADLPSITSFDGLVEARNQDLDDLAKLDGFHLGTFGFINVVPLLHSPARQFHVASSTKQVIFAPEGEDKPPPEIGPSHPIYIWPRLYLLCTNTSPETYVCVDEALLRGLPAWQNLPADKDYLDYIDQASISEWTATGSRQARDPFFNLAVDDGDFGASPTLWERNNNLDSGFEYPRFHPNRPLESAGELGYLAHTQNVTVALASVEGAALLDRFTVYPTNRLERAAADRIQPNSPYGEVIARLFDEPLLSRPLEEDDLPDVKTLTNAWLDARAEWQTTNAGDSWNTFAELLPAVATKLVDEWPGLEPDDESIQRDERKLSQPQVIEDLLRGLADRVTFRQNIYVVIIAAQRLSPLGRVIADQRVAVTVIRDAYTGRWAVHDWRPLTE